MPCMSSQRGNHVTYKRFRLQPNATESLQAREIYAPGTCQTRGGHPGQRW